MAIEADLLQGVIQNANSMLFLALVESTCLYHTPLPRPQKPWAITESQYMLSWKGPILSSAPGCAQDHPQEPCGHHLPAKDALPVLTQWCGCECRCIVTQPQGRGWPLGVVPSQRLSCNSWSATRVVLLPLQMCQTVSHLPHSLG